MTKNHFIKEKTEAQHALPPHPKKQLEFIFIIIPFTYLSQSAQKNIIEIQKYNTRTKKVSQDVCKIKGLLCYLYFTPIITSQDSIHTKKRLNRLQLCYRLP